MTDEFRVPPDVQPKVTEPAAGWARSTFSHNHAHCVEVARAGDTVMLRHAGYPDGPVVAFRAAEFEAFLDGVAAGDFDHLTT